MRQGSRRILLVVVLAATVVGAVAATPGDARADHTYKVRLLDTTAYSLYRRQFRIGFAKISYGIANWLQISTYTLPWILGAALEEVAPNLEFKSTFYNRRRLALSASFEFAEGGGDTTQIEDDMLVESKVNYLVFVTGLASSIRFNSHISTHLGGQFTATDVVGDSDPTGDEIRGVAVVNMLQIWGMLEWRVSPVVALTLTGRWLPYVSDTIARAEFRVDESTGAIVEIEVEVFDLKNAFAVLPGAVFSWKRANLRMGIGYGDFFVESVGLVIPGSLTKNIAGEFDLFVRF